MNDMTLPFDLQRVDAYLKQRLDGLDGTPEVTAFQGGASNLTFRFVYPARRLILRRPPPGRKAKGAHDMGREYRILNGLRPHFPRVPRTYLCCDDEDIAGAPFFVMEELEGVILRGDLPADMSISEFEAEKLCDALIDTLVDLHKVDMVHAELTWLERGEGYVGRQISGWTRRYRDARTPDAAAFDEVIDWLERHQPEDRPHCLIHNDFRFDNLVLDPDQLHVVVGVLDWELATAGDPLMDLGASLAYWVQADDDPKFQMLRRQPTHLPGMLSREQLVARYLQAAEIELDDFSFYEIYGLFRLAGIAQQIYYRHYHGQFRDDRFAQFIHAVNYLEQRCLERIRASGHS